MTIFKTLIIHRHQALRQSKLVFNSLRLQSVSSIAIESNDPIQTDEKKQEKIKKEPLHQMFAEAVGVRSKLGMSDSESEDERNMIKNLKKLEKEISRLKEVKADERVDHSEESVSDEKAVSSRSLSGLFSGKRDQRQDRAKEAVVKPRSLSGLFCDENVKRGRSLKRDAELEAAAAPVMLKKLSTEMLMFVEELYKGGYFYDANFLPGNVFDASYFEDSYSRDYIKFASDRFAKDHQEIAKWLSGSQVKTLALYGCPNLIKNSIFPAKRLRSFFRIQEDTVSMQ
uniref:Uncharacterized protein n=1 Tax=Kalanchoe fedtschenkoi TaxID=63787 RepID=A0A7N0SY25_KALFE